VTNTAQVILEVLSHDGKTYLHPIKAHRRYSPTLHMLHLCEAGEFVTVVESATISRIMTEAAGSWVEKGDPRLGVVNHAFLEAERVLGAQGPKEPQADASGLVQRLLRSVVTRDVRLLGLVERHFDLREVVRIRERMIGTGLIGGKSVGMLLARKILERSDPQWSARLEPHDSFFVGSDVYYTFVVRNGLWWLRERQK
jgi:hypothetical protein